MSRPPVWVWVLVGAAVVALLAWLLLHKHGGGGEAADAAPTATVTLAAVRSESLSSEVHGYGVIQPSADAAATVSAPKAAVIIRLMVGAGQQVRAGQPMLQIANAPSTEQAYRQASAAVSFAETDLERVQRLAGEHLATNEQVSTAQKTLADARAALAAQRAQGASIPLQTVLAPYAAVVTAVSVKPGDRVAQDAPLLTLARSGALVASLNVQPDAALAIAPGQTASVVSSFGGAPLSTRVAAIGKLADPTTRAVQVVAPVPAGVFPVGEAVQASIATGAHRGLVVPRAAVVFDETGTHVFTIMGGKAQRVFVRAGADHGSDIEVQGPLSAGAMVAVQGAYELQDGMGVRTAGR